ncbi:MAG: response regulator [Chthoniobacterales bacterium]|nr:response regulator [Chthoniobacterales bacterium]
MNPKNSAVPPATLLLVDDNTAFREMTAMALCSRGYDVEPCGSPEAALELASGSTQFQLLITDVVLGKTNGIEVAARIRAILPHVKVLFCSGYPETALARQGIDLGMGEFLMKPMSIDALCSMIEQY